MSSTRLPEVGDFELLHGVDRPPGRTRLVSVGGLTVELDGAAMGRIRHQGTEIVRGIVPTVRDEAWGTVPIRFNEVKDAVAPDAVPLHVVGRADDGVIGLDVVLEIRGGATGDIAVGFAATARRAFRYCRIGLTVLHPPATAGKPFVTDRGVVGEFPSLIEPVRFEGGVFVPMIPPFRRIEIAHEERTVALTCSGDDFETEDQRNWTDASFKTYSTPLALGFPHEAQAGQVFEQAVSIAVERPS